MMDFLHREIFHRHHLINNHCCLITYDVQSQHPASHLSHASFFWSNDRPKMPIHHHHVTSQKSLFEEKDTRRHAATFSLFFLFHHYRTLFLPSEAERT
jgi:hypothetical protein